MEAEDYVNGLQTPANYEEAIASNEKSEWKFAMGKEMRSLQENKTWKLADLPKEAKALPCKWVYRLKTNSDGSIDKFKARLVIKGYNQRCGIDYDQTFSPVAKMASIRAVLSIAATEKMILKQFDVSTAFLYGELEETIYMKQPEGFSDGTDKVCQLKRSLYGLKQAPRCWNKRVSGVLTKFKFRVSEADPCLYFREENGKKIILVLYVDDGLVAGTDENDIEIFLNELSKEFKIVSKEANYFLGLEIQQGKGFVRICQRSYAKKILERFNFQNCKSVSTPIISNSTSESGKEENQNFRIDKQLEP